MVSLSVIILAAGLGKRTLQPRPKVTLETLESKPLLSYVLEAVAALKPKQTVVVVGHGREYVETIVSKCNLPNISCALQPEQKGTGHAAQCGLQALSGQEGPVLILYGDMPLISEDSLQRLLEIHESKKSTASLLTVWGEVSSSYGRIIRDAAGNVSAIREAKDCTPEEKSIRELNAGFYIIEKAFLEPALRNLAPNNAQGELYLTDVIGKAAEEGQRVETIEAKEYAETLGVNDLYDLHVINNYLRQRTVTHWIRKGVRIPFSDSVLIGPDVSFGTGVYVGANTQLLGKTSVGNLVRIDGTSIITNSTIGDESHIKLGSTIEDSVIGSQTSVGPFVNLRPESKLGDHVRVGNFVEVKKSVLENGSKVPHLSYVGDALIGEEANLGGGTITCNYDGYKKSKTTVGKYAFVGSNSSLVAPVTIGEGSVVGAGSTITKDVIPDSLALTRAEQVSKAGWAKKRRDILAKK